MSKPRITTLRALLRTLIAWVLAGAAVVAWTATELPL